jgi:hypothetical protein
MTSEYRNEKLAEAKAEYASAEVAFSAAINKHERHTAEDSLLFWSQQISYFQNSSVTPEIDWAATYAAEDRARNA